MTHAISRFYVTGTFWLIDLSLHFINLMSSLTINVLTNHEIIFLPMFWFTIYKPIFVTSKRNSPKPKWRHKTRIKKVIPSVCLINTRPLILIHFFKNFHTLLMNIYVRSIVSWPNFQRLCVWLIPNTWYVNCDCS